MKLQTEPATWLLAHAKAVQPQVDGFESGAMQLSEVGVDARLAEQRQRSPTAPQAQRTEQADIATLEHYLSALVRLHAVVETAMFAGLQTHPLWQLLDGHAGRDVIEQLQLERSGLSIAHRKLHRAPVAQRQAARQATLHLGCRQAPQPVDIEQCRGQQYQQQPPPDRLQAGCEFQLQRGHYADDQGQQRQGGQRNEQATGWTHARGAGT